MLAFFRRFLIFFMFKGCIGKKEKKNKHNTSIATKSPFYVRVFGLSALAKCEKKVFFRLV